MTTVVSTETRPIKLWLDDIEDGALAQAKNLANLPFVFKHIAVMPDSHHGYGMPIGGVMATQGVVVPNAVGVDIGCGMCAVKTALTDISDFVLREVMEQIRAAIPVGFNKHQEQQAVENIPDPLMFEGLPVVGTNINKALYQVGTLGGGNHFIEIQKGSDGHIWVMIHSGSRNLGKQVADYYNRQAILLNEKYHSSVPREWDLAFLPLDSYEGNNYLSEMEYCVEFALANRKLMMERIELILAEACHLGNGDFDPIINIAHNYATMEYHFGQNVMVHRKGATLAREGTVGIIPGSQGTSSYIVVGKGNKDSFESCSHGAGRKMGRNQAIKTLSLEDEVAKLDAMGVIHAIRSEKDLDEAPGSYKNIDDVMANQTDLVDISVSLRPLAVIKG